MSSLSEEQSSLLLGQVSQFSKPLNVGVVSDFKVGSLNQYLTILQVESFFLLQVITVFFDATCLSLLMSIGLLSFPIPQEKSGSVFSNTPPSIPGMDKGVCAKDVQAQDTGGSCQHEHKGT